MRFLRLRRLKAPMTEKSKYKGLAFNKAWWLGIVAIVIVVALAQLFIYGNSGNELETYILKSEDITSKIDGEYLKLQTGLKEVPGSGYALGTNDARQVADDLFHKEDIAYSRIGGPFFSSDVSKCAENIHLDHLAQIRKLQVFSEKTMIDPAEIHAAFENLQTSLNMEQACLAKLDEHYNTKKRRLHE